MKSRFDWIFDGRVNGNFWKPVLFIVLALLLSSCSGIEEAVNQEDQVASTQETVHSTAEIAAGGIEPDLKIGTETISPTAAPDGEDIAREFREPTHPLSGLFYFSNTLNRMDENGKGIPVGDQALVDISRDGRHVVFSQEDDLWTLNLETRELNNLTKTPNRREAWGGQVVAGETGRVVFTSLEVGEDTMGSANLSIVSLDGSDYHVLDKEYSSTEPAISPDGQILAYETGLSSTWLYRLGQGKEPFYPGAFGLSLPKDFKIGSPSWSPDGGKLAWWVGGGFGESGSWKLALVVFDLEARTFQLLHPYSPIGGSGGWLPPAIWGPDGNWVALITHGESAKADLWVVSVDGSDEHHLGFASDPVWRPDGQSLLYREYPAPGTTGDTRVLAVEVGNWTPVIVDLPPGSIPIGWVSNDG